MTAGRKPTPLAMKVLDGRARPREQGKLDFPKNPLQCPRFLDAGAKREWRRLKPEMQRLGLLTIADRAAFAAYCQAWSRYEELTRYLNGLIKEMGTGALLMNTPNGALQQNPLLGVANRAFDQMRAMLAEFGLSPSSRARLTLEGEEEREDGVLDD